jgi:predicted nucleotide-binding protein
MQGAKTLIEKFERHASHCNYAIAIMSPDDKSFAALRKRGDERFRARQNVLIELGWFMAHLGRDRAYIVVKGNVEIPSDIVGVEVIRCNRRISECAAAIKSILLATRSTVGTK